MCDRFAAEGFSALAPDMYHGQTASEPDGAGKLFMALNIAQAEKDLRGAAAYPGPALVDAEARRGGLLHGRPARPLRGHAQSRAWAPCVNFYGIHPNVKPDYSKLAGPVLGLFAEKDGFVTPQVARDTDAAIKKAGKQSEIHIYPNVDHAFFNDEHTDAYNKAAADDAWRRTLGLFRQHLK